MYYQKIADETGDYVSEDGTRCALQQCRRVRPTTGWTEFPSLEAALNAWHLTYEPIPEPQTEK